MPAAEAAKSSGAALLRVVMVSLIRPGPHRPDGIFWLSGAARSRAWIWIFGLAIASGVAWACDAVFHDQSWVAAAGATTLALAFGIALVRNCHLLVVLPTLLVVMFVAGWSSMRALIDGVEHAIVSRIASYQGHVTLSKYGLDFSEYEEVADIALRDLRVRAASPFAWGPAVALKLGADPSAEPELFAVAVKGLVPHRADAMPGLRERLTPPDTAAIRPANLDRLPSAMIGHRLARNMGLTRGDRVRLIAHPLVAPGRAAIDDDDAPVHIDVEFVGLVELGIEDEDRTAIWLHLTAAQALLLQRDHAMGIELALHRPMLARDVARDLDLGLNEARFRQGLDKLYRADSWLDRGGVFAAIRDARATLALVSGAMLVLASLDLALLTALVAHRKRRSLAILRLLGATSGDLVAGFLAACVSMAVLGATVGVAIGYFVARAIARAGGQWVAYDRMIALDQSAWGWETWTIPVVFALLSTTLTGWAAAMMRVRDIQPHLLWR